MSNLIATLGNVATSFITYEQALNVISNNTTNATTAGYANQDVAIVDTTSNGAIGYRQIDTRDAYAEYSVQSAQSAFTFSSTTSNQLQSIQALFDLNSSAASDSKIGGTLNQLFSSFSQLSANPNNAAYRQAVLTSAGNVASAFNAASNGLDNSGKYATIGASSTATSINAIVSQIQQINVEKQRDPTANSNPNLNAQLYGDLENLSKLVNFTTIQSSDGTVGIYLGGQHALLVGSTQFPISAGSVNNQIQITDSQGKDITSSATGGQLGGDININNTLIPSYRSQLNTLASTLADTVNTKLQSGLDQNGNPGAALFSYSSSGAASSLALTSITTAQIAAASAGNPGGNDNAIALSDLSTQTIPALGIATFSGYYGSLETAVGNDSANSQNSVLANQQLLSQAQTLRSNSSGVSLDQEAALLTQYQQAYNATSRLISVVNSLLETAINLIPSGA